MSCCIGLGLNFHSLMLKDGERLYYRDRLREARYAALADAEGFGQICFAIESLGLRLLGKEATLNKYAPYITTLATDSPIFSDLSQSYPHTFKSFDALFEIVRVARNDAMHLGAYARHATAAGIELCIGLEDSIMANVKRTVGNLMVTSPVVVEPWQPVAHARQQMLMHSFSFLPLRIEDSWYLISELSMAKYLGVKSGERKNRLGCPINCAAKNDLKLLRIENEDLLDVNMNIDEVLQRSSVQNGPSLWLVIDKERPSHLAGILTPFELM